MSVVVAHVATRDELNSAIASANSENPPRDWTEINITNDIVIDVILNAILVSNVTVRGVLSDQATTLSFTTPSTLTSFFRVGNSGATPSNILIENLTLRVDNSPNITQAAIEIPAARNVEIRDIRLQRVGPFLRIGALPDGCKFLTVKNISGGFNPDLNAQLITINRCTRGTFRDINLTGPSTEEPPTASSGKIIYISSNSPETSADKNIDTLQFDNINISAEAGIAHSIYMDSTNNNITNVWFNECVFDRSTEASVTIKSGPQSATVDGRATTHVWFTNCHLVPSVGPSVVINFHTRTSRSRGILFDGNLMLVTSEPSMQIDANGRLNSFQILDNKFEYDIPNESVVTSVISIDTGGFTCIGNTLSKGDANGTVQYFLETVADIDDFTVVGNTIDGVTAGCVLHFNYVDPARSLNRQVHSNPGRREGQTLIPFYTSGIVGVGSPTKQLPISIDGVTYYIDLKT